MRSLFLAAAGFVAFSTAASAAPVTIDFDGLGNDTVVSSTEFDAQGVSFTAVSDLNELRTFDINVANGTGDTDLEAPLSRVGDGTSTPMQNVLIIQEDNGGSTPDDAGNGGTFVIDFAQAVTFLGFDAVDFTDGGSNIIVNLFFDDGDMMSDFSFDFNSMIGLDVGDNQFFSFDDTVFGLAGVANVIRATIQLTGSGAIDNIQFDAPEVPVPAALPLLLSGLAGLGFASRRRRAVAK